MTYRSSRITLYHPRSVRATEMRPFLDPAICQWNCADLAGHVTSGCSDNEHVKQRNQPCWNKGKKRGTRRGKLRPMKKRNRNDFAKVKCPRSPPSPDWLNRLSVYGRRKEILNFAAHVPVHSAPRCFTSLFLRFSAVLPSS